MLREKGGEEKPNPHTFIFEMGMSAPLAFVDQIQFMVAILIDEITARKLIRVLAYWLLHVGPAENLKEESETENCLN